MATALYRRYRPESFADVIGQEHVTEPLMQALRTGRVNHAYLFSGPRGCGKTTSARILARCLNCEHGPTPTPCGTCESCVALSRGGAGSVDVIEIDAASHGGVDDARDLRERASYGPAQSRYKIYIIDEAHMVTPQGFNALLKIVEEPPEHVKFIFATTEPEKVIGTIRSRTHHYPFRLVPPAKLGDYMQKLCDQEGVQVAPGVLSFVTRAGGGSVRDSLSVLDQLIAGSGDDGLTYDYAVSLLGFTDGELLDATIDALAAGDGAATFRQIDKVIESGHDPRRFIEDLLERLRDLIIVAAIPEGAAQVLRGVPEDQLERMRVQQSAFGPGALSRAADICNTGLTEMTGATAPRLHLELICARILLPAASGDQGYAARIDRLERRLDVGGVPSGPAGGRGTPSQQAPARPANAPVAPSQQSQQSQPSHPAPAPTAAQTAPVAAPVAEQQPSVGQRAHGEQTAPPEPTAPVERSTPQAPAERQVSDEQAAPNQSSAPSSAQADPYLGGPMGGAPVPPTQGAPHSAANGEANDSDVSGGAGGSSGSGGSSSSGGMDTDAIRRAWPEVLGRVFQSRRITWTFVSQHAQVLSYADGVLTLGISTAGLTNTFRQGNHAEIVRQALIDELGVEARVEGVHAAEVTPTDPYPEDTSPPAPMGGGPSDGPDQTGGSPAGAAGGPGGGPGGPGSAGVNGTGAGANRGGSGSGGPAGGRSGSGGHNGSGGSKNGPNGAPGGSSTPSAMADAGLSPAAGRSLETNAGWGSVSTPAPDWATAPAGAPAPASSPDQTETATQPQPSAGSTADASAQSAPTPPVTAPASTATTPTATAPASGGSTAASGQVTSPAPTASAARGASAVRESLGAARRNGGATKTAGPSGPAMDDSIASADDEDIEVSTDVGRGVIESVLGGKVIAETDD